MYNHSNYRDCWGHLQIEALKLHKLNKGNLSVCILFHSFICRSFGNEISSVLNLAFSPVPLCCVDRGFLSTLLALSFSHDWTGSMHTIRNECHIVWVLIEEWQDSHNMCFCLVTTKFQYLIFCQHSSPAKYLSYIIVAVCKSGLPHSLVIHTDNILITQLVVTCLLTIRATS